MTDKMETKKDALPEIPAKGEIPALKVAEPVVPEGEPVEVPAVPLRRLTIATNGAFVTIEHLGVSALELGTIAAMLKEKSVELITAANAAAAKAASGT